MKYWITKAKEKVEIAMMTDVHIERCLKMLGYYVSYNQGSILAMRVAAVIAEADRRGLDFEPWIEESEQLHDERREITGLACEYDAEDWGCRD